MRRNTVIDEETLRGVLGSDEEAAALLDGWAASQTSLPAGELFFLEPRYIATVGDEARLDPGFVEALLRAAREIAAQPVPRALAWHVYQRLRHDPVAEGWSGRHWPLPNALLGDQAGLLYTLALLGGVPEVRAFYRDHGVPDEVARATLHDVQRGALRFRRRHGAWGLAPRNLGWLRLHLSGGIFELGRLQYQPGTWGQPARAFRHRTSGAVVALSEQGVRYRADGQRDGAGGVHDPEGAWTARLQLRGVSVVGHLIRPTGQAERAETHLLQEEWAAALTPGDAVLHLHIPAGEPLELEACRRSLEEALRFFPACFPAQRFVAFSCDSWLLDAQLEDLLPPSSNLVRFLRQMYLLPVADDGHAALEWVFGDVPTDLRQAPRDTTLRRALLDHVLGGGRLRGGACFLLPADLPRWGADTYRPAP